VRCFERGDETNFEFTAVVIPLMSMILLIAFASVVRAAQMPAWMAASECARAAIATQDEELGREQAERAAIDSLSGNPIYAATVRVDITGDWTPNSLISCRVSYDIDVSGIAGFAEATGGSVPMVAEVGLRIEPHKSRWR
jgi:Flp pilus assembly protein TadG